MAEPFVLEDFAVADNHRWLNAGCHQVSTKLRIFRCCQLVLPAAHGIGKPGTFTIRDRNGARARWSWDEFKALPHETITPDIHCVTKWSKFNTMWDGVSVDHVAGGSERPRRGTCALCARSV